MMPLKRISAEFYRDINGDDEFGFKARFEPAEGKLDLEVAFYDRGMFPPGAYHSEGHQDGMGVCLYLALMKRLLGDRFRFGGAGRRGYVGRSGPPQAVLSCGSRDCFPAHNSSSPHTTGYGRSRSRRRL